MIDAAVLAAIAAAVDRGGDLDRALAEIGRVDPLLRGAARKKLRAAHADARLAGPVDGPDAEGHALRLAYLMVARAIPPRAARRDVAAVEAAFAEARAGAVSGRAFWWPSAIVGLAILGVAMAGIGAAARASGPPLRAPTAGAGEEAPPPAPEVRGAFVQGGVPAAQPGDAALTRSLGTDLPAFLTALDQRSEARRAGESVADAEKEMREAEARALGADVRGALGAQGAKALEALVAAARTASEGKVVKGPGGFGEAAAALDDALAARGLGYFVDGDVITQGEGGRPLVLVYSYRVARVAVFAAGATTVRALHLRRLDRLNWSPTLLGFTRPTLRAAAVLLDQLEEQVVTVIAPGLADGASLALFDPGAPPAERAAVEARAGAILREDYGAIPDLDRVAAAKLGKLLGKRRALFARWSEAAEARGLGLRIPTTIRLPEGFSHAVEALASRDDREDLALVQAALDDQTRLDAFAVLRDALAASVERHEVQHRLDAAAPLPMPATLEARVGAPGRDGDGGRLAASARDELSAYLAEIAAGPRAPRVSLTLLSRFLFDRRLHGTAESYAALTVLEGLGAALGAAPRALVKDRAVDRAAVGALWMEVSAEAPDRLRAAAGGLWSKLFGRPLPEVRRVEAPK